jgi:hypothetical protein
MSNQDNSSHNDYLITKLEFEKFNFFRSNNRSRNVDENNRR